MLGRGRARASNSLMNVAAAGGLFLAGSLGARSGPPRSRRAHWSVVSLRRYSEGRGLRVVVAAAAVGVGVSVADVVIFAVVAVAVAKGMKTTAAAAGPAAGGKSPAFLSLVAGTCFVAVRDSSADVVVAEGEGMSVAAAAGEEKHSSAETELGSSGRASEPAREIALEDAVIAPLPGVGSSACRAAAGRTLLGSPGVRSEVVGNSFAGLVVWSVSAEVGYL